MPSPRFLIAALTALALLSPAAQARPREKEQDVAFRGKQQGRFQSLRAIVGQVAPQFPNFEYLGAKLIAGAGVYQLTFMNGRRVVRVDVDARTGQVIGTSGN